MMWGGGNHVPHHIYIYIFLWKKIWKARFMWPAGLEFGTHACMHTRCQLARFDK